MTKDTDLFNVEDPNYATNAKVSLKMGSMGSETCAREAMDVLATFRGEMSDEQKKHLKEGKGEVCTRDLQNPLYFYSQGLVPKTPACTIEAIRYSSLRKYTGDLVYKKVSFDEGDYFFLITIRSK